METSPIHHSSSCAYGVTDTRWVDTGNHRIKEFGLIINMIGTGSVTLSPGTHTFDCCSNVTITAEETDPSWEFSHWSGDASGTDPSITMHMDTDKRVTAHFTEQVTWDCPLDHVALIAPYPLNGRPFLSVSADLSGVTYDVEWFQVLWFDETSGEWLTYYSEFTTGNTLLTLEPDQYYYVVVSQACELAIPQSQS